MSRIIAISIAALLLLLCIADIALWIRGYSLGDTVVYRWIRMPRLHFVQLYSASGGLRIMLGAENYPTSSELQLFSLEPGLHYGSYGGPAYPIETWGAGKQWGGLGFYYYHLSDPSPPESRQLRIHRSYNGVTFPHAILAVLLTLWPLRLTRTLYRRRRQSLRSSRGQCIHCGYDLRGLSDRCPECGAPIPNFN